ncbi:MAG: hypothetical protein QGG40_14000 [Myxococcota bacterium]|nr:hypothetical protein [Myxococcota bacterium]
MSGSFTRCCTGIGLSWVLACAAVAAEPGGTADPSSVEAYAIEGKPIDMKELVLEQEGGLFRFYLDGRLYTGNVVRYHENGQKTYEGALKKGKNHGTSTRWYETGEKKSQSTMNNGRLHGTVTEWYRNGNRMYQATYENGSQQSETKWYENGQKSHEEIRKNGIMVSEREWDEDGTLTRERSY